MLDIVVHLQEALWLEAHKLHAGHALKVFDLAHFLLVEAYFLAANRIVSANLIAIQDSISLLAAVLLRTLQHLVVHCVDLLGGRLAGLNHCREEAQADLGPLRYFKHAFPLNALFVFLLTDALHELAESTLGGLYVQQARSDFFLLERDE